MQLKFKRDEGLPRQVKRREGREFFIIFKKKSGMDASKRTVRLRVMAVRIHAAGLSEGEERRRPVQ